MFYTGSHVVVAIALTTVAAVELSLAAYSLISLPLNNNTLESS